MNRFQRQLEVAMIAINQLQDEHTITVREYAEVVAENKRLKFAQYGTVEKRSASGDALLRAEERAVDSRCGLSEAYPRRELRTGRPAERRYVEQYMRTRTKIDAYFDVIKWRWIAEAVVPYTVMVGDCHD